MFRDFDGGEPRLRPRLDAVPAAFLRSMFLGLASREESVRDALGVLARILLAASVDPDTRKRVTATLSASLPWTTFLPNDERAEFFEALTSTAAACAELDTFEPLARVIEGWRASAEVHANP